ncbi:hypothetical protein [Amycolatopsis saalfeldensis]|uniref:Uncharacterized protein n=1 Tax=Amycolatopsis saalfeldensis TaxID=394193 RepID=A0A1H8Y4L1_9PSEU|nr:hypothetical protein [Amycolatopsis saalfeldensis]SEP47007.1 hypothetical protein SAMN04489732_11116 [Amycolatopsis saalfeldensis]
MNETGDLESPAGDGSSDEVDHAPGPQEAEDEPASGEEHAARQEVRAGLIGETASTVGGDVVGAVMPAVLDAYKNREHLKIQGEALFERVKRKLGGKSGE